VTSKADILKYLKDSFVYVHKAIASINESNLVGTVKSPFGEGSVTRLGLGNHGGGTRLRPLRADGGVFADERNCATASRNGG